MMCVYKLLCFVFFMMVLTFNVAAGQDIQTVNDSNADAAELNAPWGHAKSLDIKYKPHKLLYDLTTDEPRELDNILDRASYLFKLYESEMFDSSIVIVIHGDAIAFFARDKFSEFKDRMYRANSLTIGTTIEFRMCKAAAKVMKYDPEDIHGFVKMVPMADAEIVRLQLEEGYAYMQ